ncbi:MAG: efflux RND transporter permease subunit [Planctomycetota bacterium]
MNPIRAIVARPYTVAVAVILLVLFSVIGMQRIPIQLKPTVDIPRITVRTAFRGASAVEVEEQVTRELEEVLQNVQGLVEMTSDSAEGSSTVTLEFEYGADTQLALVDVLNKLNQVPRLPAEADEPIVSIASAGDRQVVMWIRIESHYDVNYLRRLVQDEVEPHIERIPGVASLFVVGGSEREVQIRLDAELMVARGVTFDEVFAAVQGGNVNVRGGTVETAERQHVVRTVGRARQARELGDLIVKELSAGSVRVGDVATVVDGYREKQSFVNMDGEEGVGIGVQRQVGTNVVDLIADIDGMIARLNAGFARRGLDIRLDAMYRETSYINAAMDFVRQNLAMGAGLAVIVLLFFLRSPKSVLIIALSIPISLIGVFLVLLATGRTLNVISLAGIAFASGMVVDNAIVILENTFRHLEMGKGRLQAAIDGGREMWGGVLASTLTTVAVFVPIVLQQDEASQIFTDIALAISAAVLLSLLVALSVVPVLCSLVFRDGGERIPRRRLGPVGRSYAAFCGWLAHPRPGATALKLGLVLLVAAGSLATLRLAPSAEYLPTGNRNLVLFFAEPIPGTRVEAVKENYKPFERFVLAQPEADRIFAVSGGFNGGGVILKEEYATAADIAAFHSRLFGPAMSLPGFRFVVPIRASIFENPGKQFEVEISGPDIAGLERGAAELQSRIRGLPGVDSVRSSLVTGRPEYRVTVDEDRAKDIGLDVAEVGRIVETVVAGRRVTEMIDGGREVDLNVLAPQARVASDGDLAGIRFVTRGGEVVSLGDVARVERTTGPQSIRRLERQRNALLTVDIAQSAPLEAVVDEVEGDAFPAVTAQLGAEYDLRVGGSADALRQTLRALTSGFGLSILIVYLLMVSLFRSWLKPFVILVTVPLALSGGLIGIRIASELTNGEAAFDVIAMLGFVILAGIVVNNAILIVHQANNFREQGLDMRTALSESARTRLRPILMTVTTTIFAMLPLAIGGGAGAELYQGLAAVIVGGLSVSALFTLFVVPAILSLGHDALAAQAPAGLLAHEGLGAAPAGS